MPLSVIILAGGAGTRMGSQMPKVLHRLADKPLLEHVINTVEKIGADRIYVVFGHQGEQVRRAIATQYPDLIWVEQKERLGTGHAVLQVLPQLKDEQVLILCGDVPLIGEETLSHFVQSTGHEQLGLLTATVEDPSGLGRIVYDDYHQVKKIVEEKDASELEKQITEINAGVYCAPAKLLHQWLPELNNHNAQGEYYLTDIVSHAREESIGINVSQPKAIAEIYGVNSRVQLAKLERIYQRWQAEQLMISGVSFADPNRVDIRGDVIPAIDCWIDVNVIFSGEVTLGRNCRIGANVRLHNVTLADDVTIFDHCILEDCTIHSGAEVGPFARIRPDSVLAENSKVGNFVELKKTYLGKGSKVNHLAYLGDSQIGAHTNIGAGVITCNYDGANKHQTIIEEDVFIGSDVQLIAPITIAKGATIGAGSTITKDVGVDQLSVSRAKQTTIDHWQRPKKT